MHDEPDPEQRRRQAFLAIMLAVLGGSVILLLLILLTGGYLLYVLAGVGAIAVFAIFHYLLWGHMLMEETAGKREEEELRKQTEDNGWPKADPNQPRHL